MVLVILPPVSFPSSALAVPTKSVTPILLRFPPALVLIICLLFLPSCNILWNRLSSSLTSCSSLSCASYLDSQAFMVTRLLSVVPLFSFFCWLCTTIIIFFSIIFFIYLFICSLYFIKESSPISLTNMMTMIILSFSAFLHQHVSSKTKVVVLLFLFDPEEQFGRLGNAILSKKITIWPTFVLVNRVDFRTEGFYVNQWIQPFSIGSQIMVCKSVQVEERASSFRQKTV